MLHVLVGHEVVIAKAGRPWVRLTPLELLAQGRLGAVLTDSWLVAADP